MCKGTNAGEMIEADAAGYIYSPWTDHDGEWKAYP